MSAAEAVDAAPELSVVICCYNRFARLGATLDALNAQTIRDRMEILVVDDGSTPPVPEEVVARGGAVLVRHPVNRGLTAARNTGWAAARSPVIAFTDDDCRPAPTWAERLLAVYTDPAVLAAGGPVVAADQDGFLGRYYQANPPAGPLEAELGRSEALPYRLWLYLRENVSPRQRSGIRPLFSMAGANMSFRRVVLERLGGFEEDLRGAEEEEICRRMRELPGSPVPWCADDDAVVEHEFVMELADTVRRARTYGSYNAHLRRKHGGLPIVYPLPLLWLTVVVVCLLRRRHGLASLLLPVALLPRWAVLALRRRSPEPVLYAYVQMLQEAGHNVGLIEGFRASARPFDRQVPA